MCSYPIVLIATNEFFKRKNVYVMSNPPLELHFITIGFKLHFMTRSDDLECSSEIPLKVTYVLAENVVGYL